MLTNLVFPTADLIACANRELGFRKSCYPKWAKVSRIEDLPAGKQREIQMMAAIAERLQSLNDSALALQAFKNFVHDTLDTAGVDKHEEQNATTGCRVGARLADLIAAAQPAPLADEALAELEALEQQATPAPWTLNNNPKKWVTRPGSTDDEWRDNRDNDAAFVAALRNALPGLLARVRQAEAQNTALQAFKDYVHGRLDAAGIYKHVEQNAINGCRIGARLDDAFAPRILTAREQRAIDNINAVLDGDGTDPEAGPGAWADCGEVDVPVLLDAVRRLRVKGGQQDA